MKKHAAGIALFILIVILSALGYAFFQPRMTPETVEVVEVPVNTTDRRRPTRPRFKPVQAIAHVPENELVLVLKDAGPDAHGRASIAGVAMIELGFYTVGPDGPRLIRTDVIEIQPKDRLNDQIRKTIRYEHHWFGDGSTNLYVAACSVGTECGANGIAPFSEQNSAPVLLAGQMQRGKK
ncbi:MAG: hypothetical protein AB7F88_03470 [Pyrinomonadaceae bacterium]